MKGLFDAVRRSVALADRRARGDADDDVGEVLASRSPQPEPSELHGRVERRDRPTCDPRLVLGRAIHEHVDVPTREPHCGGDDEPRDEQRCDRVPGGDVERRRDEAGENGDRPCEVAPEVERVGEQRVAAVEPGAAERDHRPRRVDREHERDRRERPPGRVDVELDDTGQAQDRGDGDADADEDEEAGLGERGEVLRLRVSVGMASVGGAHGHGDGEEREQRRSEVRPRVRGLGEQAEARAREAGDELDDDEETRGPDRDERGAPLRRHSGRLRRGP